MYNGPPMHLILDIVLIEPVISLQADNDFPQSGGDETYNLYKSFHFPS